MKPCPLCSQKIKRPLGKLVKCDVCGFVQAQEDYFSKSTAKTYLEEYYHGGDYLNYEDEKASLQLNFKNRLKIIREHIKSGHLLEIGSAYGYFLELAEKFYSCEGIEYSKTAANSSKKILKSKIYDTSFEKALIKKRFDVIVSLDTIEHVKDPNLFFNFCANKIKGEGYIFLETGNIDAFLPRIQKENWRLIYPPEHLNYFSKKTISLFLKKYGFEVLDIIDVPFNRSLGQVMYRLSKPIFNLLPTSIMKKNIELNTYDLMFVVAKKRA